MRPIHYDDVLRARDWGLDASFLEAKMDSSVLVCICQAMVEAKLLSNEGKTLLDWALASGAQMRHLQANSALFFQVASLDGAAWVWRRLLEEGYALDKVVAKVTSSSTSGGKASRVTSKLGLLCSPPYCLSHELSDLIALLVDGGVDPNERDSDGYAPLGRLNEQLRQHEANNISIDLFVPALVKGVNILLDRGAEIEGVLPIAETFAAKCIQESIRAKRERAELLQQVIVPESTDDLRRPASRAL
jgi:hypothetical protein